MTPGFGPGIGVLLLVELIIYGHDGHIQVCVGQKGITDFAMAGKPPTPKNIRKRPFCSERSNLGMWGKSAEQSEAALKHACGQAARYFGPKGRVACLRNDGKWTRQVTKEQIMPWDSRLYKRLLWLD